MLPSAVMPQGKLQRQLGALSATSIVVANMVGTGIFTLSGFLIGDLGSPWLLVGVWFAGAVLALAGALCYSELSTNFPRSGGEYVYLTEAWGPVWGFVTGWVSFFAGFSGAIAAAGLAVIEYLSYFFPALQQPGPGRALACGVVIVFHLLNVVGLSPAARVQNFLTVTKIAVLAAFVFLGISMGQGDWSHFSFQAARSSTSPLAAQFLVSLVLVYFGYSGWNAATYVAEEVREPERTIPRSLVAGTILVAALYCALNVVFVYANHPDKIKGAVAVGAQAASSLFGAGIAGLFSGLMAFSLLSTINAMAMIGPRVYYAMAGQGAFFGAARQVHPRWNTPWIAVLAQCACCCLLIVASTFRDLVQYVGFSLWLFTLMSVAGLFRLRRRPGWKPLPAANFLFPLIPGIYIAASGWALINAVLYRPRQSVYGLLTIATGALVWALTKRRASSPPSP